MDEKVEKPENMSKISRQKKLRSLRDKLSRAIAKNKVQTSKIYKFRLSKLRDENIEITDKDAADILFGPIISKQQRKIIWEKTYPKYQTLTAKCCMCHDVDVNLIFSGIMELKPTETLIIVCQGCQQNLKKGWRKRDSVPVNRPRVRLWLSRFGIQRHAKCVICQDVTLDFVSSDWHACHDIAKKKGGRDDISNLVPGCGTCNLSMGTLSISEHQENLQVQETECFRMDDDTLCYLEKSLEYFL